MEIHGFHLMLNCYVDVLAVNYSQIELIKILINVNPIGSYGSCQPCQLVEANLQSYYRSCLNITLRLSCCCCDIYLQTRTITHVEFFCLEMFPAAAGKVWELFDYLLYFESRDPAFIWYELMHHEAHS